MGGGGGSLVSEESFGGCTVQCFVLDVSLVSCIIIIPIYFVSLMEKRLRRGNCACYSLWVVCLCCRHARICV